MKPQPFEEEVMREADMHLTKSAPSMDKFEKASALNFIRSIIHRTRSEVREEIKALPKLHVNIGGENEGTFLNYDTLLAHLGEDSKIV